MKIFGAHGARPPPRIPSHTPSLGRTTPPHRPHPAAAPLQNFPTTPDKVVEGDPPNRFVAPERGFKSCLMIIRTHTNRFLHKKSVVTPFNLPWQMHIFGASQIRGSPYLLPQVILKRGCSHGSLISSPYPTTWNPSALKHGFVMKFGLQKTEKEFGK